VTQKPILTTDALLETLAGICYGWLVADHLNAVLQRISPVVDAFRVPLA
jgi:hypothetical protein